MIRLKSNPLLKWLWLHNPHYGGSRLLQARQLSSHTCTAGVARLSFVYSSLTPSYLAPEAYSISQHEGLSINEVFSRDAVEFDDSIVECHAGQITNDG